MEQNGKFTFGSLVRFRLVHQARAGASGARADPGFGRLAEIRLHDAGRTGENRLCRRFTTRSLSISAITRRLKKILRNLNTWVVGRLALRHGLSVTEESQVPLDVKSRDPHNPSLSRCNGLRLYCWSRRLRDRSRLHHQDRRPARGLIEDLQRRSQHAIRRGLWRHHGRDLGQYSTDLASLISTEPQVDIGNQIDRHRTPGQHGQCFRFERVALVVDKLIAY